MTLGNRWTFASHNLNPCPNRFRIAFESKPLSPPSLVWSWAAKSSKTPFDSEVSGLHATLAWSYYREAEMSTKEIIPRRFFLSFYTTTSTKVNSMRIILPNSEGIFNSENFVTEALSTELRADNAISKKLCQSF